MRNCCSVLRFIAVLFYGLEFSMDDIVDRVMNCYGIEPVRNVQSRDEVKAKAWELSCDTFIGGQRDADQLIEYGVAYLRGLHEGPDFRYTGSSLRGRFIDRDSRG